MEYEQEIEKWLKEKFLAKLEEEYPHMKGLLIYDSSGKTVVAVDTTRLEKCTLEVAVPGIVNDLINKKFENWKLKNLKPKSP